MNLWSMLTKICGVALALAAGLPASAASVVTGSEFAVSESGAAVLTIPLQVPRGIAGMEPQLALNYSSGSGNGLLGLGWMLSGPSAVTRCAKDRVLDGARGAVSFKIGDRYCLDGQRLDIVSHANTDANYGVDGSLYRTQRDTFSRITAIGQYGTQTTVPASFKVETKAGLILEFGLSANSQVLTHFASSALGTTTINRWMLQRISDRHGSFVEFIYCGGEVSSAGSTCSSNDDSPTGSKVLRTIRYTNRGGIVNGELAVVFGYESRPDRIQMFQAGSSFRQTQRLSRIETYRDYTGPGTGQLVRGYDLTYQPIEDGTAPTPKSIRATNSSRLLQIQERDKDGNTLPPVQFTLASDEVFGQFAAQRPSALTSTPSSARPCGGVIANRLFLQCL